MIQGIDVTLGWEIGDVITWGWHCLGRMGNTSKESKITTTVSTILQQFHTGKWKCMIMSWQTKLGMFEDFHSNLSQPLTLSSHPLVLLLTINWKFCHTQHFYESRINHRISGTAISQLNFVDLKYMWHEKYVLEYWLIIKNVENSFLKNPSNIVLITKFCLRISSWTNINQICKFVHRGTHTICLIFYFVYLTFISGTVEHFICSDTCLF